MWGWSEESQRPNVGVIDVEMVGGKSATQCWSYRCGDGRGNVSDPMLELYMWRLSGETQRPNVGVIDVEMVYPCWTILQTS